MQRRTYYVDICGIAIVNVANAWPMIIIEQYLYQDDFVMSYRIIKLKAISDQDGNITE